MGNYWLLFELLLKSFNDLVDGRNFYLFEIFFEISLYHSIQVPKRFPYLWIEVVFNIVVSSNLFNNFTSQENKLQSEPTCCLPAYEVGRATSPPTQSNQAWPKGQETVYI